MDNKINLDEIKRLAAKGENKELSRKEKIKKLEEEKEKLLNNNNELKNTNGKIRSLSKNSSYYSEGYVDFIVLICGFIFGVAVLFMMIG